VFGLGVRAVSLSWPGAKLLGLCSPLRQAMASPPPESPRQRRTTTTKWMALCAERERNGTGEPAHTEATRYVPAPPKIQVAVDQLHKARRNVVRLMGPGAEPEKLLEATRTAGKVADGLHKAIRLVERARAHRSTERMRRMRGRSRAPRRGACPRRSRRSTAAPTRAGPGPDDDESDADGEHLTSRAVSDTGGWRR
jgi:hypothetical protein